MKSPEGFPCARNSYKQIITLALRQIIALNSLLPPKKRSLRHFVTFHQVTWWTERLPACYIRPVRPGEWNYMISMPAQV